MPPLSADRAWFMIAIEGGPDFEVYAFEGREKLNEPFEFTVEVVSRDANVDLVDIICRRALLTVADHSGGKRTINGSIREAQQLHTANLFTHYRLIIVPRLWYMGQNQNHRIFQNMSVIDIFQQIFKQQGFPFEMVDYKLKEKYQPREYCVQYAESDLYFISRLCEEEGIYYYFEHQDDYHTLCFSDAYGGPNIPDSDGGLLRFFPGSGQVAETAVITRLNLNQRVNSDRATYREWNFEQPDLDLEVTSHEQSQAKAPAPGGLKLDTYQFPHLYDLTKPGQTYSDIQLKRQITFARWVEGEGNVSRLLPGFSFTVESHPRRDVNAQWWLTEVHHKGEQPQVLKHEAPDRGFFYKSDFIAIPFETRFVPTIVHPKKRVEGLQSAIVTGPGNEEIYVDEYGRVKVEFHWDRRDLGHDGSSCWVRVSQGWAGGQYGTMAIPRVGHEVIVEFMEGDPDRPLITGRVYNAATQVPYELPKNKTRSIFKSLSSPGGGGFNELRIEDRKRSEEIYVHAEKDVNTYVKNDWKDMILRDRHQTVKNNTYVKTEAETHEILNGHRKAELHTDDNLTVDGDGHASYGGRWLVKSGDEIHLAAGVKFVIEAGTEITIKAGGSFIRLDPSGVKIEGSSVKINSGASPGEGSGANPLLPIGAEPVEKSLAPPDMLCSCRQAVGMPFVEIG